MTELQESREAEQGYGEIGARELRLREWASLRGERDEPAPTPLAFKRLVWRLQAKKYWRAKNPESKAKIIAYRKAWAEVHKEQYRAAVNAAKRRRRAHPEIRAEEAAEKRARRAVKTRARRDATVYSCAVCGVQWSPVGGRLPSRPPKYCTQPCRSRANYRRGRAQGKAWALRGAALRAVLAAGEEEHHG